MFCLVAGAAGISDKDLGALEKKIEEKKAQGKRSIYFIQAKSTKMSNGMLSPTPTLELIKTKSEQHVDMLGLQYQAHGAKISRLAYRLPRAELGDDEGYSREQQLAAHRFAESQVYSPRRDLFDDRTNATLLRDLGIQTVQMRTRSRTPTDPDQLSEIVSRLITAGVLTPDEAREIASDIFGRDFEDLLGVWSKLPPPLLTALLQTKNQLIAAALMSSEDNTDVLEKLREAFSTQTGVTDATRPGQVPIPQGGNLLTPEGGNGASADVTLSPEED
jgi:capsid portal protein